MGKWREVESGSSNIETISVNSTPIQPDENKNVNIAIPDPYDDTDIKAEIAKKANITSIPSKVSELTNDSNYQTAEQISSTVATEIAKVVANAPEDFDTLKEMSDWIAGHENDASATIHLFLFFLNSHITINILVGSLDQTSAVDIP